MDYIYAYSTLQNKRTYHVYDRYIYVKASLNMNINYDKTFVYLFVSIIYLQIYLLHARTVISTPMKTLSFQSVAIKLSERN